MQEETNLPVYFAPETEELRDIYDDLVHGAAGDQASSAWEGEVLVRSWHSKCTVTAGFGKVRYWSDHSLQSIH